MDYDEWRDMHKDIHGESPTPKLSKAQFGDKPQPSRAEIRRAQDKETAQAVQKRLGHRAYGEVARGETWPVGVSLKEITAIRAHHDPRLNPNSARNPYRPGQRKDIK